MGEVVHLVATARGNSSWQQLVAMLFAQVSAQSSLRDVAAAFNAHPRRHYHLGAKPIARSTLADANAGLP